MTTPAWGNEGPGYDTRTSRSYRDLRQETARSQGYPSTSNDVYHTQEYFHYSAVLPTPRVAANLVSKHPPPPTHTSAPFVTHLQGYFDATLGVNGPLVDWTAPNSPESSEVQRAMVPQLSYKCGTNQKGWDPMPAVHFSTRGVPGVGVLNAFHGCLEGLDGKDSLVDMGRNVVTGRMNVRLPRPTALSDSILTSSSSSLGTNPTLVSRRD